MNYVSALELEGVMQRHPAVQECLAFARPSSDLQDLVSMVVVLKTDHEASLKHNILCQHCCISLMSTVHSQVTVEELTEHVNRQVADHKMIRGGVLIRESIPRNSMGKLVRRTMRKWALEQFEKKKMRT